MNVEELKERAEDVQIENDTSQPLSEAEQKFLRSAIVRKHRDILRELYLRLKRTRESIDDIKQKITNKTCTTFSTSQRIFIVSYTTDFLKQLLSDMYSKRDLNELYDFSRTES